jgi:chemosensory pili system protein ChpA (sensor histidine kinase/response regulator)
MKEVILTVPPHSPVDCPAASDFTQRPARQTANPLSAQVLLAEDYLLLAKLMEQALAKAGYDVTVVHDGRAAIDSLRTAAVDLAILDIDLPELSGFEICSYLRNRPRLQHLPVIICTGRDGPEDHARALELRTNAFITKPFVMAALLQSVRSALASSPQPISAGEGSKVCLNAAQRK